WLTEAKVFNASNVQILKRGAARKRAGFSSLGNTILGGGTLSAATRLFPHGMELCASDGDNAYSYSPTLAVFTKVSQPPRPVCLGRSWVSNAAQAICVNADCAIGTNGVELYAWQATSNVVNIMASVFDATGAPLLLEQSLALYTGGIPASSIALLGPRVIA